MITHNQKLTDFKNIKLFKGLSSLRFFAAFLVVMHHSETIREKNGLVNFEWLGLFKNGGYAVSFFFVLSGFLITYLLLKEKFITNDISIKKFYLKRVLRIWPLYFLLIFIGTICLPYIFSILDINYEMPYTLGQTWYYFVFFLPGLVTFYFGHHLLEPLWSIGVEELFYLIWAPLFKISQKKILISLIVIIVLKILLHLLGLYFIHNELFNFLTNTFQFEAMAIGGLGAYFLFTNGHKLTQLVIFKPFFQVVIFLLLATFLLFHSNIDNIIWNTLFKTQLLSQIILDLLFLYLIICVSVITNSVIKLNSKFLTYLGDISYGIYMYHMLVIFATILFLKQYLLQMNIVVGSLVYYIIVSVITIIIASLSKRFFENYFLRLKNKLNKNKHR